MLSSQAEQLKKAGVISENYVRASRASELLSTGTKELTKKHRAKALTKEQLLKLIAACEVDIQSKDRAIQLKGIRDRAILLFSFAAGGRRRSEVAAAMMEYLEIREGGYLYTVQKSKTDQQGEGLTVPVQGIAAAALTRWMIMASITEGPLFRRFIKGGKVSAYALSDHSINTMVKERVIQAGLNPSYYSAHSLRAGFMTEGALQGLHVRELMQLSGHSDINTALTYVRPGEASNSRAARLLG
jgi:integrase